MQWMQSDGDYLPADINPFYIELEGTHEFRTRTGQAAEAPDRSMRFIVAARQAAAGSGVDSQENFSARPATSVAEPCIGE